MADTVVVITAAEFSPNPVAAGSPAKLSVSVIEVTNAPSTEVCYPGELYGGEV